MRCRSRRRAGWTLTTRGRWAGSLLAGLAKMAKALEEATYAPGEYEKIARSAAHAMKSADGLVRLMEFARDGRTRGRTWGPTGSGH